MSARAFPADPSFPQLKVATDPELMQEVFQRYLRPLDKEVYQVRRCRIFSIRYQPHVRYCRVQYVLRLAEPGTGREQNQWVTGLMYAEDRLRWIREKKLRFRCMWERLQLFNPRRATTDTSPTFAPSYYVPDLKMSVLVFPYDRGLPALPFLVEGPPRGLEPLLLARFGPGDWQTEAWEAEPVRYRAGQRATLRLGVRARDAATDRTEKRRFYAKVYHHEKTGKQTHEVLWALWNKASAGGTGFTVARPITYLGELRVLVQEEAAGTSLEEMLLRGDEVIPAVRKVARALAALHLDHGISPPRRRHPQREEASVKKIGKLLQWAYPHLNSEIKKIVGAVVAGLEEVSPTPTHCDLKPEHIMLDGDRLTLLDLDHFAMADPVLDVARLLAFLANAPLRSPLPQDSASAAARAFAEEYFAHVPEAWRARLPLHYAIAVLKMAGAFFRQQPPGFPDKIEALVEEAQGSLTGKVW